MSQYGMINFARPGGPDPRGSARLRAALVGGMAALAASSLVMAQPAGAEEPRQIAVSFRDLDLTRAHDLAILRQRVATAARRLCHNPVYLSQGCVTEAVRAARPQIERAVARSQEAVIASVLATVTRDR